MQRIWISKEANYYSLRRHDFHQNQHQTYADTKICLRLIRYYTSLLFRIKCDSLKVGQSKVKMLFYINYPKNCGAFTGCKQNLLNQIKDKIIQSTSRLSVTFILKDGSSSNVELTYCSDTIDMPSSVPSVQSHVAKQSKTFEIIYLKIHTTLYSP